MPNRIRPLRRTGSAGVPTVTNMLDGEIAVNAFTRQIWMRVGANLVEVANVSGGDWNTMANKPANLTAWASIDPNTKATINGNPSFSTVTALGNHFYGGPLYTVLSPSGPATGVGGILLLRPDGAGSGAGQVEINVANIITSHNVLARDFKASRGDGTGVIFLNAAETRYLFFDGTDYQLPTSSLNVGGRVRSQGHFTGTGAAGVLSSSGSANGAVYLRPFGADSGNGQQVFQSNGEHTRRAANESGEVRVPRVFVQPTDPGAAAAEGDLWIW